ncbi:hypothetical protein P4V54_20175 [Brevibacillus nitrificans]|uniref:hypothetical protein n=1 Tax=Brevibacillus nitrificans TaxID=651560 RepID=UPI002E224A1D|nr:hypothetical protein [Brevibacillus nitrificans]
MREITLQCSNCGSEEAMMPIGKRKKFYDELSIQCKCGKWLVKDGVMGSPSNIKANLT